MQTIKATNVDHYIAGFPEETQKHLNRLRSIIRKAAPAAEESISYGMPAYKLQGTLVYFGGFKNHVGFYPTASGIKNFQEEIAAYKNSKGAVQFPLNEPLPVKLVEKIVTFRVNENAAKNPGRKQ